MTSSPTKTIRCVGCGATFDDVPGPTHRYMESCPGCWAVYGEVLAREYSDRACREVHRLTVDAYAVQHPGRPSPQSIQSVAVHLMSLCLVLEENWTLDRASKALSQSVLSGEQFFWLEPPSSLGAVTVADVRKADSVESHVALVKKWAESAWLAWVPHHTQIRAWIRNSGLSFGAGKK